MTTSAQPSSGDTGAATPVRLDLTAWRLLDGRLLVTPHGAPAAIMEAPDFTAATFTNGYVIQPPAPRKALPAPREAKVKTPRKIVKKAAVKAAKKLAPPEASARPDEDRQRRLVEAKGIRAAAEELGVAYKTLWARARARGWTPKRLGTGGPKPAEAERAPSALIPENMTSRASRPGVHMTVPRRCDDCGARTDEDPCHACKAPWDRRR